MRASLLAVWLPGNIRQKKGTKFIVFTFPSIIKFEGNGCESVIVKINGVSKNKRI